MGVKGIFLVLNLRSTRPRDITICFVSGSVVYGPGGSRFLYFQKLCKLAVGGDAHLSLIIALGRQIQADLFEF